MHDKYMPCTLHFLTQHAPKIKDMPCETELFRSDPVNIQVENIYTPNKIGDNL